MLHAARHSDHCSAELLQIRTTMLPTPTPTNACLPAHHPTPVGTRTSVAMGKRQNIHDIRQGAVLGGTSWAQGQDRTANKKLLQNLPRTWDAFHASPWEPFVRGLHIGFRRGVFKVKMFETTCPKPAVRSSQCQATASQSRLPGTQDFPSPANRVRS